METGTMIGAGAAFRRLMSPGDEGVKGEREVRRSGDSSVFGGLSGRIAEWAEVSIRIERRLVGGEGGRDNGARRAEWGGRAKEEKEGTVGQTRSSSENKAGKRY
jgi:hypothetical protein